MKKLLMVLLLASCTPDDHHETTPPDAASCSTSPDAQVRGCDGRGVPLACGARPIAQPLHGANFVDADGNIVDKPHVIVPRDEFLQEYTYRHAVETWIDCVLAGDP